MGLVSLTTNEKVGVVELTEVGMKPESKPGEPVEFSRVSHGFPKLD